MVSCNNDAVADAGCITVCVTRDNNTCHSKKGEKEKRLAEQEI